MAPLAAAIAPLAAALAALAVVCACLLAPAGASSAATFAPVSGAGSTSQYQAIQSWISGVASSSGLTVSYLPNGSVSGLNQFSSGGSDWAASEYPYGATGTGSVPPARGYAYVPDTGVATALMYNLTIGGQRVTTLRLSGATVAGIFTGVITTWNDPQIVADNPGLVMPATAITPVVRSDGDGQTEDFTQWLAATQGSAWTAYCQKVGRAPCTPATSYPIAAGSAMIGQPGDSGVSTYVSQSSSNGAIGYTAPSWAQAAGFPVAKVLNAAGYYTAPTPGNIGVSLLAAQIDTNQSDPLYLTADLSPVYGNLDPRTYELSSYSYLVVPTDLSNGLTSDKGATLGAFGQYALCQGQQQAGALGYAGLPGNLVEAGFAQLARIPGADVPTVTAASLQGCGNPAFTTDGTDAYLLTTPDPTVCDKLNVTCATIPVGVGTVATTTTLIASPNPGTTAQTFTLTAGVAPASGTSTATGTVQFRVGPTLIGAPVSVGANGIAVTTTTFAAAGTEALSAAYTPANPNAFEASTGTYSLTVNPVPDSGGIPLAVTDPPSGAFTFTVDTADIVTLTVSGLTATAATTPITVSDTRNTFPGWVVSGQATEFTGSGTAAGGTIAGSQLGWTPTSAGLGDAVALGPAVTPASPGLGSAAAALAFAHAGHGFGTSTLGANLTLAIPPATASGPYTAGLTVTAVTSYP